jgi:putative redox protein
MKIDIRWVQDAMFIGESESGHAIVIDGPQEGGGRNLGARPMELLLMGMGACTAYDVVHILRKGRHDVTDCVVELEGERAATTPKVFTRIHIRYVVTGHRLQEEAVRRAVELTATKYCSASIMLSKVVDITHSYEIIEATK